MKINYTIFLFLFFAFAKAVTAQTNQYNTDDVTGYYVKDYQNMLQDENYDAVSVVDWSFTLSPDGTFKYHNFRQLKDQDEEHWYAKGTWRLDGKIILLSSNENDLSEKYNVNLNNSKIRFFKKSARNKSQKAQSTYIQFFESEYSVAQGLKLFKADE